MSGEPTVKVWDAKDPEHPKVHHFDQAHRLGIHHVAVSDEGSAATVGYEGGLKLWDLKELKQKSELSELLVLVFLQILISICIESSADDTWAVSLSPTGDICYNTTHDGRIIARDVRDLRNKIGEYATKGSFGLCVDTV